MTVALIDADRRTGGQIERGTDMTKVTDTFRDYAKARAKINSCKNEVTVILNVALRHWTLGLQHFDST